VEAKILKTKYTEPAETFRQVIREEAKEIHNRSTFSKNQASKLVVRSDVILKQYLSRGLLKVTLKNKI
jgi:hypothetical protein